MIMEMEQKHTPETSLCKIKDLEMGWNISQNSNNNNVYVNYLRNPKKNKQYKIIDMGVFCMINDVTPDLLRVFVANGKAIIDVMAGKGKNIAKDSKKVVVMSEKEYETYTLFKKMKAFNESTNG